MKSTHKEWNNVYGFSHGFLDRGASMKSTHKEWNNARHDPWPREI